MFRRVARPATTLFANIAQASDRDGLTAASAKVVYTLHAQGEVAAVTAKKSLAQTQVIGDNHFYSGQVNLTNLEPNSIDDGLRDDSPTSTAAPPRICQHTFKFRHRRAAER